jgi:hypothetical protein
MARIEGLTDADAGMFARYAFSVSKKRVGKVTEPLRIMGLASSVLMAAGGFEMGIARAKSVDERLKTLASIKVASMVGCVF